MGTEPVRVTYGGQLGGWRGVLKSGKKVLWQCDHHHKNRDHQGTMVDSGQVVVVRQSATGCANDELRRRIGDARYLDYRAGKYRPSPADAGFDGPLPEGGAER